MRVNPAQINAYTRKIDRPLTRTGAVLDVTTARGSAPAPLPGHRPEEGVEQGRGRDLNGSDRLGRAVERDGQERLAGRLMGALGRGEVGAIQGVLTPEESRFIAALFPRQERVEQWLGSQPHGSDRGGRAVERDGQERLAGRLMGALGRVAAGANVGQVYTHAGRPMPGSIPGLRLDLKG